MNDLYIDQYYFQLVFSISKTFLLDFIKLFLLLYFLTHLEYSWHCRKNKYKYNWMIKLSEQIMFDVKGEILDKIGGARKFPQERK